MGKGTDKLYITHSEWASEDAFSANVGAGASKAKGVGDGSSKHTPYNYCALSLRPFKHPVCTVAGIIFDKEHIIPWLEKHGTNPVDGQPLQASELIQLNFATDSEGSFVDPVTYKAFTVNSHIVALGNTGNVFTWDTVDRLNIKARNWRDLVTDERFSRKDIVTLQDPHQTELSVVSGSKTLMDGPSPLSVGQDNNGNQSCEELKATALGNSARILKAKEAVAKSRAERGGNPSFARESVVGRSGDVLRSSHSESKTSGKIVLPYNAALYTTGKAAASFTSTSMAVHTGNERAVLTDEEYMLKPRRVKLKGYARMKTNHGELNIELYPEFAPKAVWNFVQHSRTGYYRNLIFHRNVRHFMIQGGDPTGTGRGGESVWGKSFPDEFDGSLKHEERGMLSMANKGKNTNTSQFFITYRAAKHLDQKHTIFGRVIGGLDTLARLENVKTDDKDRPLDEIRMLDIVVYVDPFEEFAKRRLDDVEAEKEKERVKAEGGTEDDRTTWTGKRLRVSGSTEGVNAVGKYLKSSQSQGRAKDNASNIEAPLSHQAKKVKTSGSFSNFDGW